MKLNLQNYFLLVSLGFLVGFVLIKLIPYYNLFNIDYDSPLNSAYTSARYKINAYEGCPKNIVFIEGSSLTSAGVDSWLIQNKLNEHNKETLILQISEGGSNPFERLPVIKKLMNFVESKYHHCYKKFFHLRETHIGYDYMPELKFQVKTSRTYAMAEYENMTLLEQVSKKRFSYFNAPVRVSIEKGFASEKFKRLYNVGAFRNISIQEPNHFYGYFHSRDMSKIEKSEHFQSLMDTVKNNSDQNINEKIKTKIEYFYKIDLELRLNKEEEIIKRVNAAHNSILYPTHWSSTEIYGPVYKKVVDDTLLFIPPTEHTLSLDYLYYQCKAKKFKCLYSIDEEKELYSKFIPKLYWSNDEHLTAVGSFVYSNLLAKKIEKILKGTENL